MLPSLDVLLTGIRTHTFVRPDYYARLECDHALDQRDSHRPFGSDWTGVYAATNTRWSAVSTEIRSQVDHIRKESFLIVSNATGQHEIASYVSDDFDLLCRCQILEIEHPIIEHLWLSYQNGTFPLPTEYVAHRSNKA